MCEWVEYGQVVAPAGKQGRRVGAGSAMRREVSDKTRGKEGG